ncbi:MFS transporter [Actinopolymorpha pittospori]|uniref:Putative proline/betaine transporter n=1 Tax=Actinopolymorpha pittospori TaxID=648752 RepID=A0A927N5W1_9ACTN|nr:MFS transporter [Actinopolymorpha pittospori]MBE1612247.1 MHS family proline/betaine transporter-like MFS transporter [Actinopolymorpha pittospori]
MASNRKPETEPATLRRAIGASAIGNLMEWYDYGVYGYAAAIIGEVFFPSQSTTAALLSSFGVLAVSFVIRPFGGLFFGPLGDRIGRQRVLATTIILMACSTFAIGVLPSYDQVGVWAPILLVLARLVQGFSTGGEYGGAATFMAEYAPDRRRGFLSSFLEFGTLSGYILGAGFLTALTFALPHADMQSWGWRIPFLVALPLGLVGLYLRLKLEDTPVFRELQETGNVSRAPLRESISRNWRPILSLIGVVILLNVADYTLLTYMPSYLSDVLDISSSVALLILVGVMLVMLAVIPFVGALSDRVGRKPVLLASAICFVAFSYPAFWLISRGNLAYTVPGMLMLGLFLVLYLGTEPSTLPAILPTQHRYGGFAIGYNLSTSLFGGTAPFLNTYLISATGNEFVPAFYLMLAAVVSIGPILSIPETARASIHGTTRPGTTPVAG